MRRLLPLIFFALSLVPAAGAPARAPQPRAHSGDAAAMKAVVAYARKVEACRTRMLDYTRCDDPPPLETGIRFEAASAASYAISARSRQGRRFRLVQSAGRKLAATCTPAGRGACPRSGRWKPSPAPVPNPPFGAEHLEQERMLVTDLEALIVVIERCRARTGSLAACQKDPDVEAAARSDWVILPDRRFDVQLEQPYVHATGFGSTQFEYAWLPDGTTERNCMPLPGIISPCVDGRW